MVPFSELVRFCTARPGCDKGGLYAIRPRGLRGSPIKIGYSLDILRRMAEWEYSYPEGIEILAVVRMNRPNTQLAQSTTARLVFAEARAPRARSGEGGMVTTVSKGGDVLRRSTDQGGAPVDTRRVWHTRVPAGSTTPCGVKACHPPASTTRAGSRTLALSSSAQGCRAEVRGGCPLLLAAFAAWAWQVSGG